MALLLERISARAAGLLTRVATSRRVPERKRLAFLAACLNVRPIEDENGGIVLRCLQINNGLTNKPYLTIPTENTEGKIVHYSLVEILEALARRQMRKGMNLWGGPK